MNRLSPILLATLLLPFSLPTQAAEADAGATKLLEDTMGDLLVDANGMPQGSNGRYQAADIRSLAVLETEDRLSFTLGVENLKASPEAPFAESTSYQINFMQRDRLYRVNLFRQVLDAAQYFSQAQGYDPGRDGYFNLGFTDAVAVDADAGTMTVSYPRTFFLDSTGNSPNPENPMAGWNVVARGAFDTSNCRIGGGALGAVPCPAVSVRDRMPDVGNGTTPWVLRFGIVQSGTARLSSPAPMRASDGEATTYVYAVRGHNFRDRPDEFSLTASNVPAGWVVQLPAESVKIPDNATVLFPVLVTVPFAHEHGRLAKFLVELTSRSVPASVGRIELGVRFTDPPQPTGHHARLTLHSALGDTETLNTAFSTAFGFTQDSLYMNAADTEAADANIEVAGSACGIHQASDGTPRQRYCWFVPLSPGLEMGLDFDLSKTGELKVPFRTLLPMNAAFLDGYLVRYAPGAASSNNINFGRTRGTVLADIEATKPVDIAANTAGNAFTATIRPRAEADYLPFVKGASLVMVFNLTFLRVDPFFGPRDAPLVQPGGIVTLPLAEYHDRVDTLFASNETVGLEVAGPQNRLVNPGKSVLFNVSLENFGADEATYIVKMTGGNANWATLRGLQGTEVTLQPRQRIEMQVAVVVPGDAAADSTCDLVLSATRADDLGVRSLVRLVARVDVSAEHPDDGVSPVQEEGKKTPGLDLIAIVALLALAVVVQLRRRAQS